MKGNYSNASLLSASAYTDGMRYADWCFIGFSVGAVSRMQREELGCF